MSNYSYPTNKYALRGKGDTVATAIDTTPDKEHRRKVRDDDAKPQDIAPVPAAKAADTSLASAENRSTLHLAVPPATAGVSDDHQDDQQDSDVQAPLPA
jgi:hypothetical protein